MRAMWTWERANEMVSQKSQERARKAAEVIADKARKYCPPKSGVGKSRPMYESGPHKGQNWTARDSGMLKRSIRVVEKKDFENQRGAIIADFGGVRVYAGHYLAYYAAIVEFYTPFMRPALMATKNEVKKILENG